MNQSSIYVLLYLGSLTPFSTHSSCLALRSAEISVEVSQVKVVGVKTLVDVVEQLEGEEKFPGIFSSMLPNQNCFVIQPENSAESSIILNTIWRSTLVY